MSDILTDPNLLTLLQGKTFRVTFLVESPGSTLTPADLSNYGCTFTILSRAGGSVLVSVTDQTLVDPVTLEPFALGDAPVIVQPGTQIGMIYVRLGAEITATIKRTCVYDASIYLLSDSTEVQPLASGPLLVLPYGADASESSQFS